MGRAQNRNGKIVRFKIEINVDYDIAASERTVDELIACLENEIDRHVGDGLLLYDEIIDDYEIDVRNYS